MRGNPEFAEFAADIRAARAVRDMDRRLYGAPPPPGSGMRPRRERGRRDGRRERLFDLDGGLDDRRGFGPEPGGRPGMHNCLWGTPSEGADPFGEGSLSGDTLVGDAFDEDPFGGHNQRSGHGGRRRERRAAADVTNDRLGDFGLGQNERAGFGGQPERPGRRPGGPRAGQNPAGRHPNPAMGYGPRTRRTHRGRSPADELGPCEQQ